MIKPTVVILSLALLLSSCSYLEKSTAPRQFFIETRWIRDTLGKEYMGFFNYHRMEPVVTSHAIYQGNGTDGISAYNRKSGHQIWRLDIKNGVDGGAQIIDDTLYFGANDGYFYAVKALNGQVQWTFPTKSESLGGPSIYGDTIYFLSGNNTLYALDRKTGRQKWLYARQNIADLTIRAGSRPLIHEQTLYVGFTDGAFVALNTQRGQVKWERQLSQNKRFKDIDAFPVKEKNRLYISSYDGHLFCLNSQNGQTIWRVDEGGHTTVTIEGNHLFYSSSNGLVIALDKRSGKKLWDLKLKKGVASQPKFFRGLVIFGVSQGELRVVNASDGSDVGKYAPGRGVTGHPYLDQKTGEIYFISADANLFSLKIGWKRITDTWPWEKE